VSRITKRRSGRTPTCRFYVRELPPRLQRLTEDLKRHGFDFDGNALKVTMLVAWVN
jgi:hypothetical protein